MLQFAADLFDGYGTRVYSTGVRYTGTFHQGFPNRRGILFYPDDNATYNGKVAPFACLLLQSLLHLRVRARIVLHVAAVLH